MLPRPGSSEPSYSPGQVQSPRKRKRDGLHESTPSASPGLDRRGFSNEQAHSTQKDLDLKPEEDLEKTCFPKRSRPLSPQRSAVEQHRTSKPDGMYSFPSRTTNNGVVDLTVSPPRNGATRQRINGVKSNAPNPHLGPKRLVVKNLRKQSDWDQEEYLTKAFTRLDDALQKVFTGAHSCLPLEDLYRCVENLCRQGKASTINTRLDESLNKHLKTTVLPSLHSRIAHDHVSTLKNVLSAWSTWQSQVTVIRCIYYYMDRSYLLAHTKTNLNDVCLDHFRNTIFENLLLKSKVIDGACELVSKDRERQDVDRGILRECISMFHDLTTYSSSFEPRLLEVSQDFLRCWALETSETASLPEYVNQTQLLIAGEIERCDLLGLDSGTKRAIIDLMDEYCIQLRAEYLVDSASLADMLDRDDTVALDRLYLLLKRRRIGGKLKASFAKWVEDTGTSIIFDEKAQDDMVVRLLSMQRRTDNIWTKCFYKDMELGHGFREAFETFMNKTKKGQSTWGTDNSKTGEMIAKYVDMLLRGGSKAIPTELNVPKTAESAEREEDDDAGMDEDAEVNSQLDQVLDLFRFIHGKAVFEAFYKKDLAKRLLMGRSASADAERSMLARLKTECGAAFTQNLEQMFKDVELGREEMAGYKDRLELKQSKSGVLDLSVNVLSAAAWPTYADVPVVIPSDIKSAIDYFERYYKSKHSGRKLSWKHSLAHCQMKASFTRGTKEFVVSSFQAIILLLFNGLQEGEKLSYDHIKTVSGLPETEVKRTLQSLACAKLRPLTKHPLGKEIGDADTFTVNLAFHHPRYRVRINQVQLKETKQENKETHERVAEDRNFECQAAVVRIMKSRKTIGHSELIAEVITATRSRGVLAVADIKKNIDRLIEKDYMEREEGNMYNYVA